MTANRPVTFKIKTGDAVKIISGSNKGKTGKVLKLHPKVAKATIEGIGIRTKRLKPNQANPRGGTKEIHTPVSISKVALITGKEEKTARIGYQIKEDGTKVRVARNQDNKEIA